MDPLRTDEKTRITELREAQEYAFQCQEEIGVAEDKADDLARELDEFKSLTKCHNSHELRMRLDSVEGELLTARALIAAVHDKAPDLYAEVVQ